MKEANILGNLLCDVWRSDALTNQSKHWEKAYFSLRTVPTTPNIQCLHEAYEIDTIQIPCFGHRGRIWGGLEGGRWGLEERRELVVLPCVSRLWDLVWVHLLIGSPESEGPVQLQAVPRKCGLPSETSLPSCFFPWKVYSGLGGYKTKNIYPVPKELTH